MNLSDYIRDIPDFPKEGIIFKDITPLLAAPEAFGEVIDRMAERYNDKALTAIMGIESRGFIFAAALAKEMALPFIPARKPGKLPYKTISESYALEYGEDSLEIHVDDIQPGQRVLVVDDLLATGGTVEACCKLLEKTGAVVEACVFLIELTGMGGSEKIAPHEKLVLLEY